MPVAIGPRAARHSSARPIAAFLADYFTAINERNYPVYVRLFDGRHQHVQTAQQFRAGYSSTTDSRARLVGLSRAADRWAATITFVSHQRPAASATHTACTRWHIRLDLESTGGGYLIGPPLPGYRAAARPCR